MSRLQASFKVPWLGRRPAADQANHTSGNARLHDLRGLSRGIGMRELARLLTHALQLGRLRAQARNLLEQPAAVHLAVVDNPRRASLAECLGVAELVLVGGAGQRN